jgi:hypothetical protein
MTRTLLSEFFKRGDGPWRNEAKLAFRAFHTEGGDRLYPPAKGSVEYSERLMAKLEAAAQHVRCELRGMWLAGVHFIPGMELVHMHHPEGFFLVDAKRGFSPVIVGRDQILLQCGEHPFVFGYTIQTDINPIFAHAIIPESFF